MTATIIQLSDYRPARDEEPEADDPVIAELCGPFGRVLPDHDVEERHEPCTA